MRPLVLPLAVLVAFTPDAAAVDLAPTERIVFESRRQGHQTDLYAVAAGGLQLRNLTRTPDFDEYNVRSSRDGRMITFSRGPAGGDGVGDDVLVMRNDGSGLRSVTHTAHVSEFRPTFSPDASAVAYAAEPIAGGDIDLVIADLGTGASRRVTSGGINSLPDWSPDGRRLAFTRCITPLIGDEGHHCGIWVVGLDGRDAVQLTGPPPWLLAEKPAGIAHNGDLFPVWSPDGGTLAFTRMRGGTMQTYLMQADGSNQRPLLTTAADDWVPAWSQDGSRIAFFRLPPAGVSATAEAAEPGIYLATADGKETTRLTSPTSGYEDFGVAFAAAADFPIAPEPTAPARAVPPPPAAPEVAIASSKARMSRGGAVTIVLRCLLPSVCRGRVELRRGERAIGARTFAVARELPARIRMRLPDDLRRRVARGRAARFVVKAGALDGEPTSRVITVVRGWKQARA